MQSRHELFWEEGLWGDSRAGAGYTREIEFAHFGLFCVRAEPRGLSILSENLGNEPDARCQSDRIRPERPLGRADVFGIHDKRDRLQRAFASAGLEDRPALLAGLRQCHVL